MPFFNFVRGILDFDFYYQLSYHSNVSSFLVYLAGEDQLSAWLVPVIAILASFLLMAILLIVAIVPLILWIR